MSSSEGCVVLVTGGAGFLGQHIVRLLQERADHVTEIRVLDVAPYVDKLDNKGVKPVKTFVGSITDSKFVDQACQGVDSVMHVASYVDTSLLPNDELSYKINVEGTRNVIDACRNNDVKRLLYCSTVEVVVGDSNVYEGTEDNTSFATKHRFKPYGPTKQEAERLVLAANGKDLTTLALRPAVLFGELEWRAFGVQKSSIIAKIAGVYVRINCEGALAEHVYVGNVAWSFVLTETNLYKQKIDQSSTGCAYFVVDDTPRGSVYDHLDVILQGIGLKPCFTVPIWLMTFPLYILMFLFTIVSLFHRVNFFVGIDPFLSLRRTYLFKYDKAHSKLGYTPLYTYEEAKSRTVQYYRKP